VRVISLFALVAFGILNPHTYAYNWPCQPFDQQHWINGTFCECRSGSSGDIDHFHDAVDIHLPQGQAVYSVISGTVTSIGNADQYGINSWIRIGRHAYVHVIPNPSLHVGSAVTAYETIIGWTNEWNHIHFKDGYPGSEINPIRISGGLEPLIDPYKPTVNDIRFFLNGTQTPFQNNRVFGLVDIVSRAWDHTDDGPLGGNNGIYKIGYEILDSLGNTVAGPVFPFIFDEIPGSDAYIRNVYASGSNTGTYYYTVTNQLTTDSYLNVTYWEPGSYTARVMTWDHYLNGDTLEQVFEVMESDTTPPAPPTLLSILPEGTGFRLRWLPNNEADLAGYRLYYSYDLENWYSNYNEAMLTADVSELVVPVFSTATAFFKLTAVDKAPLPNESDFSDTYVIRLNQYQYPFLLLIDAYSQPGRAVEMPYLATIGKLLDQYIYPPCFGTVNDTLFELDTTFAINHFGVETDLILHSGDNDSGFSPRLIRKIIRRLSTFNTNTWVIGTKTIMALRKTPAGRELLTAVGIDLGQMIAIPDSVFGVNVPLLDFATNRIRAVASLDSLNTIAIPPEERTFPNLLSTHNDILGITGMGKGYFVYTATPLELFSENNRTRLFNATIDFILTIIDAVDPATLLPEKFTLNFYPNPFNGQGHIVLSGPLGKVQLSLVNILGQIIWTRDYEITGPRCDILLPSTVANTMSSGIYFVLLTTPNGTNFTRTAKILYLK